MKIVAEGASELEIALREDAALQPTQLSDEQHAQMDEVLATETIQKQETEHDAEILEQILSFPSTIEMIDQRPLKVDTEYQRDFSPSAVDRMVREFSPALMGVITVNVRDDGSWYIVDGQHRVICQRKRNVSHMRAEVFRGLTREQEAWLYYQLNHQRLALTPGGKFKARVRSGDAIAKSIVRLVEQFGLKVSYRPAGMDGYTITAVGTLEGLFRQSPMLLRTTLRLVQDTWGPTDVDRLRYGIIEGMARFYERYHEDVNWRDFTNKVGQRTARSILAEAGDWKRRMAVSTPTATVIAEVLLDVYNAGKRSGRIMSKMRR